MNSRTRFNILALGTLVFLNACGSSTIIAHNIEPPGNTGVRYFNSATNDGVVRMEITGNPFKVSKSSLESLVTSEFKGAYIGRQARFSTNSSPEFDNNTRIVMFFQPARGVNQSTICNPDDLPNPATKTTSDNKLELFAALCVRKTSHSFTKVKGPMPPALNSPEMIYFIKTTARTVIPELRLDRDNNCIILPCS
jgi:hypothetical protein